MPSRHCSNDIFNEMFYVEIELKEPQPDVLKFSIQPRQDVPEKLDRKSSLIAN